MSIELMTEVWNLDLKGGTRDVLMVLADHANDDGICWPSIRRIAWKAGLDRRHVQRLLRDLESRGLVEVVQNEAGGRGNRRVYVLHVEKGDKKPPFTDEDEESEETPPVTSGNTSVALNPEAKGDKLSPPQERATSAARKGDMGARKGDIAMSPESSKNHQEPPTPPGDDGSVVPMTQPQRANEILAAALNDGVAYDRRFKGRLAREIKRLLTEGIHPRIVAEAAKRCTGHRKPDPGLMPSLIVEVQNESHGISGNGHRGHRPFDAADQDYQDSVIR